MLSWVEIDGGALRHNVTQFRERLTGGSRLGAVVKSNAYGHGMSEVARVAVDAGADWLCVNSVDEAVELTRSGLDVPLLVMGYVALDRLDDVVEHGLRPVVYNEETLDRLDELARRRNAVVPVHLKLETGTHRQGIALDRLRSYARRVQAAAGLRLEGLTTHFANIEDTTDHGFAEDQLARFVGACDELAAGIGNEPPMMHAACSAATLLFNRTHFDLARIGISLYGLWPSKETLVSCREEGKPTLDLQPVMTWKTRIAQVKDVPEGGYVGYGCSYRTTRPSRIAVLPLGYNEGYDRRLSNVAHVLVHGRRAPVRGRVCMNMCMVDVTDVPDAVLEDEVVLLGTQGDERISAEQLAAWCGTISYEIVTRVHPSLPRVVV